MEARFENRFVREDIFQRRPKLSPTLGKNNGGTLKRDEYGTMPPLLYPAFEPKPQGT